MKQRISALDLLLLARELKQDLEGYRLSNIYNIADSSKQFLLKFNKPDSKLNVVVDCGLRMYLTEFSRPIPPTPSGFVVKLRKHLKAKRLTALKQVDQDRILVLQFADGHFYLVLEFFSAGNVILLDENRRIMSLQRVVVEHENKVGQIYEMFDESLFTADNESTNESIENKKAEYTSGLVSEWIKAAQTKYESDITVIKQLNIQKKEDSKNKKVKVPSIHKLLLSKVPHLSSDLLSKNLKVFNIDPSESCLTLLEKTNTLAELLNSTQFEYNELLTTSDRKGYILAKRNENFNSEKDSANLEFIYDTFHPFKPYINGEDNDSSKIIEVEGPYNKTLDTFFSTIESSKYALRIQSQESQAQKKIDDARAENDRKIQALLNVQELNERKGHLIIENAPLIEEVKLAVQGLIDQQMDWNTIEKLIKSEQKRGNKIAQLLNLPLNLKQNKISVKLDVSSDKEGDTSSDGDNESEDSTSESSSDSDSEEIGNSKERSTRNMKKKPNDKINVTIDLGLSAYANASEYFNIKKTSAEKQKKVEKNVGKAMKNIEVKIDQQLKKKLKDSHSVLKKIRTPYFFEKYNWFISSEGFLIMMGKSPAETDQIYSKYIEDDDIYMSNNFNTHVWIKNPERTEVPPNTLMQAGILCMSSSEAWSKKIASSPWWCFAKNVSKFDGSDNSILPEGAFQLKNEKDQNLLPPAQLVMGFGFLWKVRSGENDEDDEESDENEEEEEQQQDEDSDDEIDGSLENDGSSDDNTKSNDSGYDNLEREAERESTVSSGIDSDSENAKANNRNSSTQSIPEGQDVPISLVDSMNSNVRGKRGKLKKIQKKYADQDETERLLRLEALGTLKGIEKQQQKKKEEIMKRELREDKKNKREKQRRLQALKFTNKEKAKVDYDKHKAELKASLDKGDVVVDIVPVFAPWPALLKYKYKVKIQPGSAKKTKTLTEILHYFKNRPVDNSSTDKEMDWPQEHEMIKSLKEQDLVLLLCVDKLKITIAGQKSTKNGGSSSKKGKKNAKSSGMKRIT